jgi:iron(III) transport system ATP-binding protein
VPAEDGDAVVRSSLFTPEGSDLMLDWVGIALRARIHGARPRVGDRMRVAVGRVLVYSDDESVEHVDEAGTPSADDAPDAAGSVRSMSFARA